MPSWPSSLPCQPLAGGMQFVPEVNVTEFKPDVGSPIRRRRYTGRRQLYNAEMALNSLQVADLLDFFANDCCDGVHTFTMEDWRTTDLLTFSWIQPPSINRVAPNIWRAGIQIALEPTPIPTEIYDIFHGGVIAGGRDGLWYDISNMGTLFQSVDGTGAVTADNDPVGYIADSSGNGKHALRFTADANRALHKTAAGLYWLQFDGTNDGYNIPSGVQLFQNIGEAHVFAAVETGDNAADKIILVSSIGTGTSTRTTLRISSAEQLVVGGRRLDADGNATFTSATSMALATPHVLSAKYDYANSDIFARRNGQFEIASITWQTSGLSQNTPSQIVHFGHSNGATPFLGKIYQLMVVIGSLSDDEIKRTEKFLATKCGAIF